MYIDYTTKILEYCKSASIDSPRWEEVQQLARQYQNALNTWMDHYNYIIEKSKSSQLDDANYETWFNKLYRGCLYSGGALVAGTVILPSAMNGLMVMGTTTMLTTFYARYAIWKNREHMLNEFKKDVEIDLTFLENFIANHNKMEGIIDVKDDQLQTFLEEHQKAVKEMINYCKSNSNHKSDPFFNTTSSCVDQLKKYTSHLEDGFEIIKFSGEDSEDMNANEMDKLFS